MTESGAISGRRLLITLWGVAFLLAAMYLAIGQPVRGARDAWLAGDHESALRSLNRWSKLKLRPADYDTLLAAVLLERGDPAAVARLERVANHEPQLLPLVNKETVARRLVSIGRYGEFLQFDSVARQRFESSELALYRAAAQLGMDRLPEATTTFNAIDSGKVETQKYETLRTAIDQRRQGTFPLVIDRDGRTIATWVMANNDLVAVNQDYALLVDSEGGALTIESHIGRLGTNATLETTLDSTIQRAALEALGPYRGSLVAIDTTNNTILAVANNSGTGPRANLAFSGSNEPGSVVKVLTGLAAVEQGLPLSELFPMSCEGWVAIEGRQFFDWARHGTLVDMGEAMAVSCNVAFGNLGLKLGGERLLAFLRSAGFDGSADLGLFAVPLGTTKGMPAGDYDLANLAIGLEQYTMNALHIAMVASSLANGGSMVTPTILRSRRSIMGEPLPAAEPLPVTRIASAESTRAIVETMRRVVESERGTGRRAVVPGLPIAMKTGTAGDAVGGFDSVILAFAPADAPRIAIGMIAEDAGPAEFAGARIAHDFFRIVEPHIRDKSP
ncbi:MAG TPA: penicillin-binding transpeptidase domain-containing protein [Thermoanaerobaculia bacterium]|nr:penicillin-binding transpeptidase domain-containing protein [Thermoanaerobaculia bacterium]